MDENGLYDFHQEMVGRVKSTGDSFNWHCDLDIPVVDLERVEMLDVFEEAAQWRQKDPTRDMYFSHGEYYGDGIQHIIDELKVKPTSNRALYSLLAQRDISGKGDDPIPSFLTFQCSIEHSVLYCTATFRALEVSRFLKINLEEIRQNLVEICNALPAVVTVHLHIFAFHAYVRTSAAAALRRPKIDVTSEAQLLRHMQKGEVRTLDELLGGYERSTTVVSSKSLEALLCILQMPDGDLHASVHSKRGLLEPLLKKAIEACGELTASRKGASRGLNTTAKIEAFHAAVKEFRKSLLS
ncbi:MAG: hypothetical protein Q7V09_16310 [Hydrogenophaga sp.]|uniref:hypothetical protein n=1 Tax=Hydrogenophaga sp. TaxID=1904254 RepID=UPI002722ECBF|nr:hypothetical protein [Hydrogenophaga sp.]MDO9031991.1 hypothetical protein [Hydrogenophaga sp.]